MEELIDTIVYAGRLKDKSALMSSSSGGAFTALSDAFLKSGDAVVAAVYNYENHTVEFQMILDEKQRERAKGSKYMQSKSTSSQVFKELFYGHTVLRPSCYECPYKSVIHPGDITIADYWGIEKAAPEFDDNKGVSLVLVNNEAGEKIFEKVKKRLIWKQTKLEDSMQPPLKAPFSKPDNREQFWSDFENKSFEYVAKKYGGIGLKNDAKLLLRKIKRKIKKLVVKGGKRDSNII